MAAGSKRAVATPRQVRRSSGLIIPQMSGRSATCAVGRRAGTLLRMFLLRTPLRIDMIAIDLYNVPIDTGTGIAAVVSECPADHDGPAGGLPRTSA